MKLGDVQAGLFEEPPPDEGGDGFFEHFPWVQPSLTSWSRMHEFVAVLDWPFRHIGTATFEQRNFLCA